MSNFYNNMVNKYPIVKTLSLELKPVGETRNTIRKNNILEKDTQIDTNFTRVKELINEVHKSIIDEVLDGAVLSTGLLNEMYELTGELNAPEERIEKVQELLRKEVAELFTAYPAFKDLFGEELIKDLLPKLVTTEENLQIVTSFNRLSSMFTDYNAVKKSMYSMEKKHSTIPYRLIHENLPRFLENIRRFQMLDEKGVDFSENIAELEKMLSIPDISYLFTPEGFNVVLTQKGIDWYNQVIGGLGIETGKIKGLNECINLWNQQNPREKKLPLFTQLYKQILSDSDTCSFVIDAFETDEEVLSALTESFKILSTQILGRTDGMTYQGLFQNITAFDLNGIYIKSTDLSNMSLRFCGRYRELGDVFAKQYDQAYVGKKKPGTEKYEEEKQKALKKVKERSLSDIMIAFLENPENPPYFVDWIKNQAAALEAETRYKASEMIAQMNRHRSDIPIKQHKALISAIKDYLDSVKELQWFLKLFAGTGLNAERDMVFYGEHTALSDRFIPFTSLYNKVRNYVTKKPFSQKKIKLNFESPTLLSGWSVTKESASRCMIFRKDGQIYLGIAEKNSTGIFGEIEGNDGTGDWYEKMEYRLLPGPNKMLPKVCFSAKGMVDFEPSEEICHIYRTGSFKKGPNFSLSDCHKLIDFYKYAIKRYDAWAPFNFKFSETEKYRDISDFFREISEQGYRVDFRNVSASLIDEMVEKGYLYLFKVWRKDFGEHSKGNLDLQSIYFKMLFDEKNLADVIYKLNGEAEIFYRPASIDITRTPIHKANEPIKNKNPRNPKAQSLFCYDIIKNRRYTEEKFLFHVPITMNFKASGNAYALNAEVDSAIRNTDDMHIIGINRGERNLLHIVVINSKGEIKEQFSLNTIESTYAGADGNTGTIVTDYHGLLDKKEKERDAAQANWQDMDSIKDLKKGYLGQVVNVIAKLAVKYNALIVMEDLSSSFVNRRKKIEKSIYQEFEAALIKKLNYLIVDKNRELKDVYKPGKALKAYQLTTETDALSKLWYRNGVVFHVNPWNVSNMDPTTGFAKQFSTKYENVNQAKKLISCFDLIQYNPDRDYFEFALDYRNFAKKSTGRTKWTVCTYGRRLERLKNPEKNDLRETREYYPTEELKSLLEKYHIDYITGNSVLKQVLNVTEVAFYKELLYILTMTTQMYNYSEGYGTGNEEFFQSCVENSAGEFYNSLTAKDSQPQCSDAIAAYHIAKKGLLLAERIKNTPEGDKVPMVVKNEDWMEYVCDTL